MGFRALFRGATSSAIPKEVSFDMSENSLPTLAEGEVYRSKRARVKALRGSWEKSSTSGKMQSLTSSSSHPITMIDGLTKNVEIDLKDIGQGAGAALWITDANNWWGVGTYQQSEDCNCSTYYYSCNCSTSYYSCNCSTYTYPSSYYTKYVCADRAPNGYCRSYYSYQAIAGYSSSYSCSTCSSYSCGSCAGQSCETCYPQYIRILQSVNNSVTSLMSWTFSSIIRSLKVKTLNKQISVDSYSDINQSTLIANVTYEAPTATETTKFGIMMSPSSYNESRTLSSIKIRRNR